MLLATVIFGLFCATLSLWLAVSFLRVPHTLARYLGLMAISEGITLLVTVIFAFLTYIGEFGQLTELYATGLRLFIFIPSSATTVLLHWKFHKMKIGEQI